MYDEDMFSGEISEEQVLFRQQLMINGLASRLYMDTSTGWQVNIRNFAESVNMLEASAIRHLDEEYKQKLGLIIKHAQDDLLKFRKENPTKSLTNLGKQYEITLTIRYIRMKYALLMKTLDNKGVFTQKTYTAIEGLTQDEIQKDMEQKRDQKAIGDAPQ
jgi:hypothetical protein